MFSVAFRFSSPVSPIGLRGFSPGSYLKFPFKVLILGFLFQVPFEVPLQQILRSAELAFEEGGNCNNVTFRAESSRSISYVTTTNHDLTSSGLTSITALSSFSSTSLSRRRSVPLHLRHRVGGAWFLLIYATK